MQKYLIPLLLAFHTSCSSYHDFTAMVLMRDGTGLSTQILFPQEDKAKYPVVLIRTPYKKENRIEEYQYILDGGYILVIQDVRGRFASEGKFEPYINEGKDGYDAIEWIAKQQWCDGNIGMIGASYNGSVQYNAAIEQPPHLKTIIPSIGSADLFYDGEYIRGIFMPARLMWCGIIEAIESDQEIFNKNWKQLLTHLPVSELDSITIGKTIDYYQDWVKHNYKDKYWKQSAHREQLGNIEIPVFTQTGWFDTHMRSSTLIYEELSKRGNKNVKMVIGPWGHSDKESKFYKGEFMGEAADDIILQEQFLRWFDYWLKGKENGIMDEPLVQLYAVNSNKWYSDNTYPFPFTRNKKLFLSSDKRPDLETRGGTLTFEFDRIDARIDSFIYNPEEAPVYSLEMLERGGYDLIRKMLSGRNDYLFYQTTWLEEETTILGPLEACIYASTSATDTDWYAALVTMDDENKFIDLVSIGMKRSKFRNSLEQPELIERNQILKYSIEMDHCGIKLEKGQRLGLIITSSLGHPFLAKNLNTGHDNQLETDYEIAEQRIYHSRKYQSYITIPIVEN